MTLGLPALEHLSMRIAAQKVASQWRQFNPPLLLNKTLIFWI